MSSISRDYRKARCRYDFNIDMLAEKYINQANATNAVMRVKDMQIEFEDSPDSHTLEEYKKVVKKADRILNASEYGNAHISSPSVKDLSKKDAAVCRRFNKMFEQKYAKNSFNEIPYENVAQFIPSTSVRRKSKIERGQNGKTRLIEVSEERRIIDYKIQNDNSVIQTFTKFNKKWTIEKHQSPERPNTRSVNNNLSRMIADTDCSSVRTGPINMSFTGVTTHSNHQNRLTYSKRLALPSTDNKINAMLTKPVSLKSIRKRSAPLVEVQNNYQLAIVDHERTNSKRPSTNFDARFIEWQKEAERRTQSHDFECDQYAENFDKILRQAFSRVRRQEALLRLGYRS